MNLFIKNFIDQLISNSLVSESEITDDLKQEMYPVGAISKAAGIKSACISPDSSGSASDVIKGFLPLIDGKMDIVLLSEGDVDGGEYEISVSLNGKEFNIKERVSPLAYYELAYKIIGHFNESTEYMLITEDFSGEEVFIVLLTKSLGNFVDEYQKNINYDELNTTV